MASIIPARHSTRRKPHPGKRVVFVTPYQNAAKEEAEKQNKKGLKTEIKKEIDDMGKTVYTVYVFEGGFI